MADRSVRNYHINILHFSIIFRISYILVSRKIIISAAHCIHEKDDSQIKSEKDAHIVVGSFNLEQVEDTQQKLNIQKFYVNPAWNANSENYDGDISVIVLTSQIEYTRYIRPVCMPTSSEATESIAGKTGTVAGWGEFQNLYIESKLTVKCECYRKNGFSKTSIN